MSGREIAITGLGLMTPLGKDVEENWKNLEAQRTGLGYYPQDRHPSRFHYLGKVSQCKIPADIERKMLTQMRFLNRGSLLGFVAAHEAMSQARLPVAGLPAERRGLFIASGDCTHVGNEFMFAAIKKSTGGKHGEINHEQLNVSSLDEVNPFFLLESLHNNLFSFLSAFFQLKGPNTSLASLSPCGAQALELACRSIKQDHADVALAVGYGNWITDVFLYEMEGIGITSKCKQGVESFKPLDKRRDGFIPGEGSAAVVLEELGHAQKRGVQILASVKGSGNCIQFSLEKGLYVPSEVDTRIITLALNESGCAMKDLAFVVPHGSATQKGDRMELRSLKVVLDRERTRTPICAMKPYTGHMGAASDIGEVILAIKAVRKGMAPATLNFRETEEEFLDLNISSSHQACGTKHFLSISYGTGGQSCSVLVKVHKG